MVNPASGRGGEREEKRAECDAGPAREYSDARYQEECTWYPCSCRGFLPGGLHPMFTRGIAVLVSRHSSSSCSFSSSSLHSAWSRGGGGTVGRPSQEQISTRDLFRGLRSAACKSLLSLQMSNFVRIRIIYMCTYLCWFSHVSFSVTTSLFFSFSLSFERETLLPFEENEPLRWTRLVSSVRRTLGRWSSRSSHLM